MATIIILNLLLFAGLGIYLPTPPKKRYLGKRKVEGWVSEADAALEWIKLFERPLVGKIITPNKH